MTEASLKLKFKRNGPFVFIDKIAGLNTHAPDVGKQGLVEMYQSELGQQLYVASRLDKGTSGAIVFATTPESAAELTQLFEKHQVQKKYIFLTHKEHKKTEFEAKSLIFKDGNLPSSDRHNSAPNSHTQFKFIKRVGTHYLWEARPLTGKPHQIRLHAEDSGIPVLGDHEHGGKPFYRLCLHSQELQFEHNGVKYSHVAPNPVWVNELPEKDLVLFESIARRTNLLQIPSNKEECLRWVHQEVEDYRIDQFGSHLWVYWYKDTEPEAADLQRFETLRRTLNKEVWIREMINRGAKGENSKIWKLGNPQTRWEAEENGVKYQFRSDQGMSPGLFLDQRQNRSFIRKKTQGKKVLNLFCYTGGFSVVSALGGAAETCSVDASSNYLMWTKENFLLNGINPEVPEHQFWEADCLFFLKSCIKKDRKFDLIICDPPSVGRSKEGTFQIHKNLPELLEGCLKCLVPGGEILLSTNYEGWDIFDLQKQVFSYRNIFGVEVLPTPQAGFDYELPHEEPLMKSLLVRRR